MFHPTPAFVSHIHAAKEPAESIWKGDFQHITEVVPATRRQTEEFCPRGNAFSAILFIFTGRRHPN